MTRVEIQDRIRAYIHENFLYMRGDFELGEQDSLLGNGIIDSMGVMELISFLEEAFEVVVGDADITEANLGSLAAITDYVEAHRSALV
jgi:acyl carrier protein